MNEIIRASINFYILILFSEFNACMMRVIKYLLIQKKKKRKNNINLNVHNNILNRINLIGLLCKIGNDKIFRSVEISVLNPLIILSVKPPWQFIQ